MSAMDVKLAKWAEKLGYTIAGFSDDLYEGAEFIHLPSYMAGDEPTEEELRHSTRGKVLQIFNKQDAWYYRSETDEYVRHHTIRFVYLTEDGTQVSETYGSGLGLRFKDHCPEVKSEQRVPAAEDREFLDTFVAAATKRGIRGVTMAADPELEALLDEEERIARLDSKVTALVVGCPPNPRRLSDVK